MITRSLVVCALLCSAPAFATDSPTAPPATPTTAPMVNGNPQYSLKACNHKADARNLTGKARSLYVRACRAGKSTD